MPEPSAQARMVIGSLNQLSQKSRAMDWTEFKFLWLGWRSNHDPELDLQLSIRMAKPRAGRVDATQDIGATFCLDWDASHSREPPIK
ncbi:uncharacterized protein ATNIH1004_008298 [Aspergillus tanneri]|uniref:Uncharacterized protein n=1 Tax=Aspergillus tanneri TaxID=1220188 RepID=A0A5M9MF56_9EURO|nr:uncharacterized protein ATNIH1004_008298 [Aspergillus tanneri]KAA8644100.1 hypothetical protein ATNIH1004_008298 [Aspergillus tanneri]